jgi:acetyl esterase/lipase
MPNGTALLVALLFLSPACATSAATLPTAPETVASPGAATVAVTTRAWTNVSYAQRSSANILDVYLPAEGNGPFPLVIYIHGGGFSAGSKASGRPMREYLLTKGYAVASIDYRLSGEAKFPAQIHDVKAAIRFLKANAPIYALDKTRVAVWGESAGAGLAALAATSGGVAALEDLSMVNTAENSRVQAVVDLFGPINFLTMDTEFAQLGIQAATVHDTPGSPESRLIGAAIQTRPDLCALYNPETYITSDDPPAFVQHGEIDAAIPYLQGKNFSEKLAAVIGSSRVRWDLIPNAGHSAAVFDSAANLALLSAFLDQYLK